MGKKANLRLLFFGGLIVILISALSLESQAAPKKKTGKGGGKVAATTIQPKNKSPKKTRSLASINSVHAAIDPGPEESGKITIKRKADKAPEGIPTELPEKLILYPEDDSVMN